MFIALFIKAPPLISILSIMTPIDIQMLHTYLSSWAGAVGQIVTAIPRGLTLTLYHEIKKRIGFNSLPSMSGSPNSFLRIRFSCQIFVYISVLPCVLHAMSDED
jgi:hypothetical protein